LVVVRVTASAARRIRILFNEFSGSQIVVHEFSETKVVREMVGEQCEKIDVHGGCCRLKPSVLRIVARMEEENRCKVKYGGGHEVSDANQVRIAYSWKAMRIRV
jgi:hypothetical protein